jgi:hypothetical protein
MISRPGGYSVAVILPNNSVNNQVSKKNFSCTTCVVVLKSMYKNDLLASARCSAIEMKIMQTITPITNEIKIKSCCRNVSIHWSKGEVVVGGVGLEVRRSKACVREAVKLMPLSILEPVGVRRQQKSKEWRCKVKV